MKLITLNIWGGRVKDSFKNFFEQYQDVNFFLFQEVINSALEKEVSWTKEFVPDLDLYKRLSGLLPKHVGYFVQTVGNYGISGFLDKNSNVIEYGEHLLARGNWSHGGTEQDPNRDINRKLQWFEVVINGQICLLASVHLTHRPEGKQDSEKRLKQSKIIVDFLGLFKCPKILVGDFNLLPDTESIKMIEKAGMRNLVKEYSITTTRTELYSKKAQLPFADYIFVSSEIKVKEFKVLSDVVSDHSPLYLDFEL